jgi:hypothetical protein
LISSYTLTKAEQAEAVVEPTVTRQWIPDPADFGLSARKAHKHALSLDWEIHLSASTTHHPAVLMVGDGKEKQRGEVKTPAKDIDHLWIAAVDSHRRTGFIAEYLDGKFVGARVKDPVGIPVENFVDYDVGKERYSPGWREVETYNDGTERLEHDYYFRQATPFLEWLIDWLEILAPEKAPKRKAPPAPKATAEEFDLSLLKGNQWTPQLT